MLYNLIPIMLENFFHKMVELFVTFSFPKQCLCNHTLSWFFNFLLLWKSGICRMQPLQLAFLQNMKLNRSNLHYHYISHSDHQWSKYSVIYEGGPKIRWAIASLENFFDPPPPRPLQKSHFGDQNVFLLQFFSTKTLANCNKASINNGWSSCNFRGLLRARLNPLKTDVSRRPPGLSGGPCPLGPP